MSDSAKTLSVSEMFNAPDADLVVKSCDNILFNVHRKYLEAAAGAFPPSEFEAPKEEIVSLTEDAETLKTLFQYIYPQRNPDVDLLSFESFYKLAEAAEKYEVFSAMDVCKHCIRRFLSSRPAELLAYAHKHDYPDILKDTIVHVIDLPIQEVMTILPPHLSVPWARYRDVWNSTARDIFTANRCASPQCRQSIPEGDRNRDQCWNWVRLGDKRSPQAMKDVFRDTNSRTCCKCHSGFSLDSAFDALKFTTFL